MKTLNYSMPSIRMSNILHNGCIFLVLLLSWLSFPKLLINLQPTVGLVDEGIWQLVLLAVIFFIGILLLSWWLLSRYWQILCLPAASVLVSQFKNLTSWQQMILYWASFALLLLTAVGCLLAIL